MVLNKPITFEDLIQEYNHYYPEMVKFCIDRKRRVIALDREMHIELEHELYDDGSDYSDIYGGDIMTDPDEEKRIVWEAHPNIERNRFYGNGFGREITDEAVIQELYGILKERIKNL